MDLGAFGEMNLMTRRQRLCEIYRGQVPDRPAVRLLRAQPGQVLPHPAYGPVLHAALDHTDVVADYVPTFNLYCGAHSGDRFHDERVVAGSAEWEDVVTRVRTPRGMLCGIYRASTKRKPGYQIEYLLKEPRDIETLLGLPYSPFPFQTDAYRQMDGRVGDAGITLFNLDHAMYGLQRLIGSENFALWSLECAGLMLEAIHTFARRVREHVEAVLATGLRPVFGWVGPELCIPPLMSPDAFETMVYQVDKPLIDLIHDAGCPVWVHSHGKMRPVLERFVDMGVDVLHPVEPPPMGDITLDEAFRVVGNRMGLEGNIQTHDLMTLDHIMIAEKIHAAIDAGAGRRFILCTCSNYTESPEPSSRLIDNLLFFVHEGVRAAEAAATRR